MSYLGFLGGMGVGGLFFLAVLLVVCGWIAAMLREDYQELWRLARSRQFGLLALFVLTSTVGVATMLLRSLGIEIHEPSTLSTDYAFAQGLFLGFIGSVLLFVSSGVTGLGWIVFGAYLERGETQRLKERLRMPPSRRASDAPPKAAESPADHASPAGGESRADRESRGPFD